MQLGLMRLSCYFFHASCNLVAVIKAGSWQPCWPFLTNTMHDKWIYYLHVTYRSLLARLGRRPRLDAFGIAKPWRSVTPCEFDSFLVEIEFTPRVGCPLRNRHSNRLLGPACHFTSGGQRNGFAEELLYMIVRINWSHSFTHIPRNLFQYEVFEL